MIKLLFQPEHRNFQRLWLAQIVSQFGDRINQLALIGLMAERAPGSAMGLAKVIAFTILPVFILQPFAGVIVDRFDRRTTLFICDMIRAVIVLTIPFIFIYQDSMVPIYIVVFFTFCFSRFYVPGKMAILPELIDRENLFMANSLFTTTGLIAFCLGAALGGFLIEAYGARNGFIIDAMTFLISASLLFSMNIPWQWRLNLEEGKGIIKNKLPSIWQEMREGFVYLKTHTEIRFILNMMFFLLASVGAIYVVIIVFIQESFDSVTKDLGILAVAMGIGLFLGAIGYGKWGKHIHWYKAACGCLVLAGIALAAFALVVNTYAHLGIAIALVSVLGFIIGPILIAANTAIQLISKEEMRGKVFSALEMVIHFGFLVAMLLSAWVSRFVEPVWILTAVGGMIIFVGITGLFKGVPASEENTHNQ